MRIVKTAPERRRGPFRGQCTCLTGAPLARLRSVLEAAAQERGPVSGRIGSAQRPISVALDLLEEIEQRRRGLRRCAPWR